MPLRRVFGLSPDQGEDLLKASRGTGVVSTMGVIKSLHIEATPEEARFIDGQLAQLFHSDLSPEEQDGPLSYSNDEEVRGEANEEAGR